MQSVMKNVDVTFHDRDLSEIDWPGSFHIRSPYRNDPDFSVTSINKPERATATMRFERIIDSDAAVQDNFARLFWLRDEYFEETADPNSTIQQYRQEFIRDIQQPIERLFNDQGLGLKGFGGAKVGTFRFDKGARKNFHYKNLSGGEKATFDLLLDLYVQKKEYGDAIYCIDEPEAHIATGLHGPLLTELMNLIPESSQFWIATHSLGFVRQAYDLQRKHEGSVVFIDFSDQDFDACVTLVPRQPDRSFWQSTYEIALDDISELIAPRQIVLCEGKRLAADKGFDAQCYNTLFGAARPDTMFISRGGANEVEYSDELIAVIHAIANGVEVFRLIDRDDMSDQGREDKIVDGVRVLGRRELENFLWDFEVIKTFLTKNGQSQHIQSIYDDHEDLFGDVDFKVNEVKDETREVLDTIKNTTGIRTWGNTKAEFSTNFLIPALLDTPMVLDELRNDVFDLKRDISDA